ncbi:ankyrin repeat domain-containing protein 50 [Bombina bombina]|uniref:ankyrin repeat domain-containing protein 50 n=1 Tax=Bombina bombina TaxID=8345 RepID=UPI00235B0B0A|nr:ankyrin repeat domain-containing protein 50 [Bombina bombina]XP_053564814.1 ankyrin repeat domain-containing protein 50 [Bombina bombina]
MTLNQFQGRPFYCREWALQRLQHCLEGLGGAQAHGILITGAPGAGKTTLCREILWPSSEAGHRSRLSSRVLAHHFCQAHAHNSLCPRQFIQSLTQQLIKSPLICGYKVDEEPAVSEGDLDEAFKRKILLPLLALPPPSQNLLLVVDSLDETCCCCHANSLFTEPSGSIAELLAKHHELFPPWLLLVCSTRRQSKTVTRLFSGFRRLCLDDLRKAHIVRDVQQYILCRLDREESLRHHLTIDTAEMLNQLHIKSNGCFLYLERVLDGVSEGSILLREIRHIPGTLNGLYLWLCQRHFSGRQFCQVQTLLNVILASPKPLSVLELHRAVWTKQMRGWSTNDFNKCLESISWMLLPLNSSQNVLVPFHHSFSEWLLDVKYCTQKYLCNVSEGRSMLAMSLSAQGPNLQPAEVHQLARHLLMSDIRGLEPSHLALWLMWTGSPVSDCLTSEIPLELDVLQLLLMAGADLSVDYDMANSTAFRKTLEKGDCVTTILENSAEMNQKDRAGRTMLAAAAHAGNFEAINLLLSRGANIEVIDDDGQTPLGLAAHQGHLSVLQLLLQNGAQPDHTDSRGWTPLRSAAWGGHTEVVEMLLAFGAKPDISGPDGRTAIRAAAWGGHEGPVKALLKAGAQVDLADSEGRTPLMAAAYMGHRAVADLLLEMGADVNKCDSEGRTALAVACLCVPTGYDYPDLISLLLEHWADPELQDNEGMTPLLVASYEGQAEVAELLLEAGANPDTAGRGQMTPLLAAASGGHAETVRVLLLWGAAADATDLEGRSALGFAAAAAGGEEAVRVLLDRGLNEHHRDQLGWTPLHWAACEGRRNSCCALTDGGAKVGVKDREGYTPLLLASQEGHIGCIELLLNRGSHIEQHASDGRTALCLAALGGHKGAVELLLRRGANPNIKDKQGKPIIYLLALEGLMGMTQLLLEHGADPEGGDLDERTALHACSWQGDLGMTELLLVRGKANPNALDKEGRTPLHCAAWRGHADIARLLLQSGAFADARCTQGATSLCIAAQEGHEELAKVLLEVGKASPHHADHYGRTPTSVAGKRGHVGLIHILENYGVPPYKGPLGLFSEKGTSEKEAMEEGGGSWSTLSPVSTGSYSLNNSLKSSQGSVLTSSTYHSVATVPMDSLTFTQQVHQHSLPRSRSRQTAALSDMISCQELQDSPTSHLAGSPIKHQSRNQFSNFLESELKRNCIVTNPKYVSSVYKTYDSGYSGTSPIRESGLEFTQHKTSSSGYSSSVTGHFKFNSPLSYHKKIGVPVYSPTQIRTPRYTLDNGEQLNSHKKSLSTSKPIVDSVYPPKTTVDLVHSTIKVMDPIYSPKNNTCVVNSPKKNIGPVDTVYICKKNMDTVYSSNKIVDTVYSSKNNMDPVCSPKKIVDPVCSPKKIVDPVCSPKKVVDPVCSPKKIVDPVYCPKKIVDTVNSHTKIRDPVYSSKKNTDQVYSSKKNTYQVYSSKKNTDQVYSPKKNTDKVYSPKKNTDQVSSPKKIIDPVYSPKKTGDLVYQPIKTVTSLHSPKDTGGPEQSLYKNESIKPDSPISITTMDPQLHLKQAIKLQFEGRTCGFNYRKETPL